MSTNTPEDIARIRQAEEVQARMIAALPEFPRFGYYVKTGLTGYGPDLDESDSPAGSWEGVASEISEELHHAADFAMEGAYIAGDMEGDYERAWKQFKLSENLNVKAMEFDNKRAETPLYAGRPELWHATIHSMITNEFPLDISDNSKLYVWETIVESCDECGNYIADSAVSISRDHAESCSLYPNIQER